MTEPIIEARNVSKDFHLPHLVQTTLKSRVINVFGPKRSIEVQHALVDISLDVARGEFLGIVGRNGSGKSTLLKILAGIYAPTKGTVDVRGRVVPFIELGVGFNPELTGRDNVYLNGALLGFSRREVDDMYGDIVAFAELEDFMDQKLKNYSSGMRVRIAFSVATHAEADILLIDEVLAVGDAAFQQKSAAHFRALKEGDTTIIFVTHDMDAVSEFCDRAILIEDGLVAAEGGADDVADRYTALFEGQTEEPTHAPDGRSGTGAVRFTRVSAPVKLRDADTLTVEIEAQAARDAGVPIYGFVIVDSRGDPVVGIDTSLREPQPEELREGDIARLTWSVPNIFHNGKHRIMAAVSDSSGEIVYDAWEDAATFVVRRPFDSDYPVAPASSLVITKDTASR
jgi:ABC-2 type transport system ATP-binding protein